MLWQTLLQEAGCVGTLTMEGNRKERQNFTFLLGLSKLQRSSVEGRVLLPPWGACQASVRCWHRAGGHDESGLSQSPGSGCGHAETWQRGSIKDMTS